MDTGNMGVLDRKGKPIDKSGGQRCRYRFDGREGAGTIVGIENLFITVAPDGEGQGTISFEVRYQFRRTSYVADTGVIEQAWVELV